MLRSDGYEDLPDEPGRPRFKRGAFGVLSAFFVVLLIAKTSISAVDYGNGGAVTEDAKVAPGPLARDAASTASGSIRGFRGDADADDDHTVQKLENQTVLLEGQGRKLLRLPRNAKGAQVLHHLAAAAPTSIQRPQKAFVACLEAK